MESRLVATGAVGVLLWVHVNAAAQPLANVAPAAPGGAWDQTARDAARAG